MSLFGLAIRFEAVDLAAHHGITGGHIPDVLQDWGPVRVLQVSAPCMGHATTLASRAAALKQGQGLAPATPRTQASAARKRGGGQLRRTLLAQAIAGRQQTSEGGAIESLCCAAAGIIPPQPQARARVVYPTACVRGAQKPTASLRSTLRPHAQPVEGYKHLREAAHQVAGGEA